jgi:CRP-like cAMP-binding protein
MDRPGDLEGNRLLAALADADQRRWAQHLERVDLRPGQVLCEAGQPLTHAYFPTSAVASLLHMTAEGTSTAFAAVGSDGLVGTSIILKADIETCIGAVLVAGQGLRIPAAAIQDEFDQQEPVRTLLLRYTQALVTQIAHAAVCYRNHTVDQQVCGWLLYLLYLRPGNGIVMTQELLASVLGVRRESVALSTGRLRAGGLIRYTRGEIAILDRVGLERRSCGCHLTVITEYDRLLGQPTAAAPGSQADEP